MNAKKAQMSWFVVVGLVVVIIIMLLSWMAYSIGFTTKSSEKALASENEMEKIHAYLESCEKQQVEDALILIGNQGGKTEVQDYLEIGKNRIGIVEALPSLEEISKDAASYVDKDLDRRCRPESATKKEVKSARPKTVITFNDKETLVETSWQVSLKADNTTDQSISMIKFSLPVRMKLVHETAGKDLTTPGTDLGFVDSLDNMDVKKTAYEDNILNIIIDHKSEIGDKPYKFFYAENF